MTDQGGDRRTTDDRPPGKAGPLALVRFRVRPKVVVTESGPTIRFQLVYDGKASVDVGFRLSWKGELLEFQGPTLSLSPGTSPVDVTLSLPLDSAIGRGSKVKVSVVGPGGETYAVSSTGLVSVTTAGGKTLAMGAQGVTASVVVAGGLVAGAVTYPWGDDDPVVGSEPPVVEETTTTTTTTTTEPGPVMVPVLIPDEIVSTIDDTPADPDLPVDLFPFGQPDRLTVVFDERPGDAAGAVYDVSVVYQGAIHAIGAAQFPEAVDPASGDVLAVRSVLNASDVPLLDAATGTSYVCYEDLSSEENTAEEDASAADPPKVLGGHRAVSGTGELTVTLTPFVTDDWVSLVAVVEYEVPTELAPVPGVELSDIDPADCAFENPESVVRWLSEAPVFDGSEVEPPMDDPDDPDAPSDPQDDPGDDPVDPDDPPDVVEFSPEQPTGSLGLGDEGERVRALQEGLASAGLYTDDIDGRYGPATEAAVRRLQQIEGLTVDGLAGPATHEALGLEYAPLEGGRGGGQDDGASEQEQAGIDYRPEPATDPLELGHEGSRVRALQEAMSAQGFFDGVIDGEFGPATEAAVRAVQQEFGLDVDGVAGPATHEALALSYP